jgi:phosphatidylglycerol---prolipoprotein diacylglyceryl transferase
VEYLDTVAFGLPLGIAIGRIGDVINGEHYGPATTFFLGVRNTHPDADVPSPKVAYHSGGLYEVMIGTAVFLILVALRRRVTRPTAMTWLVIRRSEFDTTEMLDRPMAAPAMSGFSRPAAASGRAATL